MAEQDVRGAFMSEGKFVDVRPEGSGGVDESTDTWDTVDYLVKHVPSNNGSVGLHGVSYPGFYAAAGAIHTHPALKAVSPQAPVSDWFLGDDAHHNGALFLQDMVDFGGWFFYPRTGPESTHSGLAIHRPTNNAYEFFLQTGALPNFNKLYFKGRLPFWNDILAHPTYDDWWRARSNPLHMAGVTCAVLTVGGLFDAEDMWGAFHTFKSVQAQNPKAPNFLVMGPWFHGMWAYGAGRTFGALDFGQDTSSWYRKNVEFPFFERYLRGKSVPPAKATVFETGSNRWRTFNSWPPSGLGEQAEFLGHSGALSLKRPDDVAGSDQYVYDPAHPTPYLQNPATPERTREYMVDDQRWAAKRSDVLTFRGDELASDLQIGGPIGVDLWVSTTGTDADFVVKVIDEWPVVKGATETIGFEQMVRGDVMRGKFRNSFEKPEPFVPGRPTRVHFVMNDVLHNFKRGHRFVVQIQSAWFPLVDRNPNKFEDIYQAKDADFQAATITIFHDASHPSKVVIHLLSG